MIERVYFTQEPARIHYEAFEGTHRVWLRKNIASEQVMPDEPDMEPYTQWYADEVYFETDATCEAIESAFDKWYEYGSTWYKGIEESKVLSNKELTKGLEEVNSVQLALCDVVASMYESRLSLTELGVL